MRPSAAAGACSLTAAVGCGDGRAVAGGRPGREGGASDVRAGAGGVGAGGGMGDPARSVEAATDTDTGGRSGARDRRARRRPPNASSAITATAVTASPTRLLGGASTATAAASVAARPTPSAPARQW